MQPPIVAAGCPGATAQIPAAREREALHVADARAGFDAEPPGVFVEREHAVESRERLADRIGAEARGDIRDARPARDARRVARQRLEQPIAVRALHAAARVELAIETREIDVGERETAHVGPSCVKRTLPLRRVSTSNRRCRSARASCADLQQRGLVVVDRILVGEHALVVLAEARAGARRR